MLKGGDGGPVVVPGKPDESPLIEAIRYEGDVQMPPKGKLKDDEIAALTEWVKRGAPWPVASPGSRRERRRPPTDPQPPPQPAASIASSRRRSKPDRSGRSGRSATPSRPSVRDAAWPRSPIDRFILARLEASRTGAVAAGRQGDPDPPRHLRPDRPAADPRGDRGLPPR